MSDPRKVPNFYGYPSDIVVDLNSGRTVVHGDPLPRQSIWSTVKIVVVFALHIPWMIWSVATEKRTWLGQIEPINKDQRWPS